MYRVFTAGLLCALLQGPAMAQATDGETTSRQAPPVDEVVVYGRSQSQIGTSQSASEGLVGYDDIQQPPLLRVGELVESVPGMVATQHSGTGKANQYFIRGFNLDHGTDFAVSVAGMPINMRSHGHGQGYLDLNFLIPELVETAAFRRGPYSATDGDFSTAASVDFSLYDRLPEKILAVTGGQDSYFRGLAGGSFSTAGGTFTGAVDVTGYDGPWALEENLQQAKLHASYSRDLGTARVRVLAQSYDADWDATDQVPRRAVASGQISDLGFIDPDLGGQTYRHALSGNIDFGNWTFSAYAIAYDLTLFSNFTYFLDDPVQGDEFEQRDNRNVYGAKVSGEKQLSAGARALTLRWGSDLRFDDIGEVALYETAGRQRTGTVRRDSVDEWSLGAFGEAEMALSENLRAVLGVRADYYDWRVDATIPENGGKGDDALLSPSAALAYRFGEGLEAYLNWGRGFHSNDVRGTTISVDPASGDPAEAVDALVQSNGAELGLRIERADRFNAAIVAFWLELDSELVYVGDAGTTEPNDATERLGIEATMFWQANEWLAMNAAYAMTDASFKIDQGGGTQIPGAVESTFTFGLNAAWENGLRASMRLRWLGEAPLTEDNTVRSDASTLVNAGVSWRRGNAEYRLDVFNLFDSDDDDIAYYYASRLPGEPAGGIEDMHFHPLEPRTLRASITLHWR